MKYVQEELIKIAVIFGGTSSEREVSLNSGRNVVKYLPKDKYSVSSVEITAANKWLLNNQKIDIPDLKQFDVVFIALHGSFGEDGQIQQLLDQQQIKYTGSGTEASKLAFDKFRSSEKVKSAGLSIPQHQLIKKGSSISLALPVVIKPNKSGSSVAVTIINQTSEIGPAIELAAKEDSEVLVQEYVTGRELTCGVLGETALPSVEIVTPNVFFDYEAKYNSNNTQEICPANLSAAEENMVREAALTAHQALGYSGLTRSDFILTKKGILYYLETNTIPGLTDASLCPKEAKAADLSFSEFLAKQVDLALAK